MAISTKTKAQEGSNSKQIFMFQEVTQAYFGWQNDANKEFESPEVRSEALKKERPGRNKKTH